MSSRGAAGAEGVPCAELSADGSAGQAMLSSSCSSARSAAQLTDPLAPSDSHRKKMLKMPYSLLKDRKSVV